MHRTRTRRRFAALVVVLLLAGSAASLLHAAHALDHHGEDASAIAACVGAMAVAVGAGLLLVRAVRRPGLPVVWSAVVPVAVPRPGVPDVVTGALARAGPAGLAVWRA